MGSSNYITNIAGDVSQHMEYFAFGETFVEEHKNSINSPFKFNGKELDEESGLYYYGARYYDPRLSIWASVDPLAEEYPNIGGYTYCANNPLNIIDPDGRRLIYLAYKNGKQLSYHYRNGNFYLNNKEIRYNPSKESISKTMYRLLAAYRKIENSSSKTLKNILHHLEKSETIHYIFEYPGDNAVYPELGFKKDPKTKKMVDGRTISTETHFDFDENGGDDYKGIGESDMTTVVHEMRHQFDYDINNMDENNENDPAEIRAVYLENIGRKIESLGRRTKYGNKIDPNKLYFPSNNKMPTTWEWEKGKCFYKF